jgi:hypothetical protein
MSVPIRDSVGAALRFARANLRLILMTAVLAALGQGVLALFGATPTWLFAVLVALLLAHTTFTSAALGAPLSTQVLAPTSTRVGATMAMVGFFLALVFFVVMFFAMTVTIAPYQDQIQAAGKDESAVRAILETAAANGGDIMRWSLLVFVILLFAVTTRFYVAAPATIDRQRITLFESWRMTRGNFLRIAGARLLLLAPAFIFVGAIQTLVARVLGVPGSDALEVLLYSQQNSVGFALFYTASVFLQVAIFAPLDAGLSASIYRVVKNNAAPAAKPPSAA